MMMSTPNVNAFGKFRAGSFTSRELSEIPPAGKGKESATIPPASAPTSGVEPA
jgi:hypothetical protein